MALKDQKKKKNPLKCVFNSSTYELYLVSVVNSITASKADHKGAITDTKTIRLHGSNPLHST